MPAAPRSAGVVILRVSPQGHRYLMLRCFNYWDFPKGEVEAGEDEFATACREVEEETGLAELKFHWGQVFVETPAYAHGKIARYYLAECHQGEPYLPVSPELARPEHDEFRWLAYEEAAALVNPRIRAVLDWAERLVAQPREGIKETPIDDVSVLARDDQPCSNA